MSGSLNIALLEPFYGGSHKQWADHYRSSSQHHVQLHSLPGRHWKWRMHGAAITMAKEVVNHTQPDAFLVSSMMDVAVFRALLPAGWRGIPTISYFHENQLAYPSKDGTLSARDYHYAFINYTSALVSDLVVFNSMFNKQSFLEALPDFLKMYPDARNLQTVEEIAAKSEVVYPGIPMDEIQSKKKAAPSTPMVLWNHRWEHDKGPELFRDLLLALDQDDIPFDIALLGQQYDKVPVAMKEIINHFGERVKYKGYLQSRKDYLNVLQSASVIPVTSRHDFYGYSLLEAIACGCYPLLPERQVYPEYMELLGAQCYYKDEEQLLKKLKSRLLTTETFDLSEAFYQRHDLQYCTQKLDQHISMKL